MKTIDYGTIWVCADCILVHANGECDPDRPEGLPEPLSAIGEGFHIAMGLRSEDHDGECTPEDREAGCGCETREFSTSSCDGCGDSHYGTRHAMWLYREADGE